MNVLIEVCAGSYSDCLAAYRGGAKRIELNSALQAGGLTPSLATLIKAKRDVSIPIICMVRPRGAGFAYDENEIAVMMEDARILLEHGADGIAFGFLKADQSIAVSQTKAMCELIHSYQKEAVFHRAFDVVKDARMSIQELIDCRVDRLLTSGQRAKAMEGSALISALQTEYGDKIQLLPGSGVNADNAKELLRVCGVAQLHSSCSSFQSDMTTVNNGVSYACYSTPHEMDYGFVDEAKVRALVRACDMK